MILYLGVFVLQIPNGVKNTSSMGEYDTNVKDLGQNNYDKLWENYDRVPIPHRVPHSRPPQAIIPCSNYSIDSDHHYEGLYEEIPGHTTLPPPPSIPPPKPPHNSRNFLIIWLKRVNRRYPKIALGVGILFASICLSTIIVLWVGLPMSSGTSTTTTTTQTTSTSTSTSVTTTLENISMSTTFVHTSTTETPIPNTSAGVSPDLSSYLMVLNNKPSNLYSEVEVLSLETGSPLPSCLKNLNNAPFEADEGAGAALSDGTPLVCVKDGKCYKYLAESDTWQEMLDNMIEERYGSGHAYNDEMGLVMAGGCIEVCPGETGQSCYCYDPDTVEGSDGYSIKPMTSLPEAGAHSCLVSVSNETLYLTGGSTRKTETSALVFSSSINDWTPVADMSEGRESHSCGLVIGQNGTNIVVVGGVGGFFVSSSTEVYNFEEDSWRQGTPFPHPITSAASVQYDGTLLVVGGDTGGIFGSSDEIYKYNPSTESWKKLDATLQAPATGVVAFMVPKSIFPYCNDTSP